MVLASMSRRMNILPAGTTLAAKASLPISERRSRLVHFCLVWKAAKSCMSSDSLSAGTRATWATVSSSMPRKVTLAVCVSLA